MAGKKKTVLKAFDYRSCDDFAAYLNHMARLGWHFKEWRAGLVFEKGQPEDASYAVEVFSGATEYDTRPEPETKEFAEYCEAAGWELVDARRKFCVFKRIRPDAVPIMTDRERLENIAKAMQPEIWRMILIGAIFTVMRVVDYATAFERYIFSDMHIMLSAVWLLLLVMALLRCGQFYLWQHQCRRRLAEGKRLFFGKRRQGFAEGWYNHLTGLIVIVQLMLLVLLGQTVIAVFYLAIIAVMVLVGFLIAKSRPDALSNQIIQVVSSVLIVLFTICFCMSIIFSETDEDKTYPEPPLTYEDIGIDLGQPEIRYADQLDGVLGNWEYFSLDYGADYLYYQVYQSEYGWTLDKIWECETDGKVNETREDCTSLWGAEEAFRNNAGNYLVRYENAIWIISPSLEEPLTQAQIDLVIAAIQEN